MLAIYLYLCVFPWHITPSTSINNWLPFISFKWESPWVCCLMAQDWPLAVLLPAWAQEPGLAFFSLLGRSPQPRLLLSSPASGRCACPSTSPGPKTRFWKVLAGASESLCLLHFFCKCAPLFPLAFLLSVNFIQRYLVTQKRIFPTSFSL